MKGIAVISVGRVWETNQAHNMNMKGEIWDTPIVGTMQQTPPLPTKPTHFPLSLQPLCLHVFLLMHFQN